MGRTPNLQNRNKILDVAYELIYKNGFKGVSMDDVAEAAHIKKANLFHYYPTKETLGLAVFDHAIREMQTQLKTHFSNGQDPIETIEAMFIKAGDEMQNKACSGGCFVGNMAQEMSDTNEEFRQKAADYIRGWSQQLTDTLSEWQSKGYFRPELNPAETAQAILSSFEGAMLLSKATRSTDPLKNSAKLVRRHLESMRASAG